MKMENNLNFKAVLLSWFNSKNLKNKWFWHHRDWPSFLQPGWDDVEAEQLQAESADQEWLTDQSIPVLSQIAIVLTKYQEYDPSPTLNRLESIPSQILETKYNILVFKITLDSGATVSYIRLSEVHRLAIKVSPNDQLALLADMKTRMASLGEVDYTVSLGNILLRIRAGGKTQTLLWTRYTRRPLSIKAC